MKKMVPDDSEYDDQNEVERQRTLDSIARTPVEMRGLPEFGQIVSQRFWRVLNALHPDNDPMSRVPRRERVQPPPIVRRRPPGEPLDLT